jgi:hypothetical protein
MLGTKVILSAAPALLEAGSNEQSSLIRELTEHVLNEIDVFCFPAAGRDHKYSGSEWHYCIVSSDPKP